MKYVVVDLEMCYVPKKQVKACGYGMEIIQIGAVLLDERFYIADEFNTYVKPLYGKIDTFIHQLTGINNNDTADALQLKEALEIFQKWLPKDNFRFVSWSMTDRNQLREEIKAKEITVPGENTAAEEWIDAQQMFSEKFHSKSAYRLSEALFMAGIDPAGNEHDGLSDAYNTAILFAQMKQNTMKVSNYYVQANREETTLSYSLAGLFSNIEFSD